MNTVNVKSSTYIDFDKRSSKEDPKFEVGDPVRISKLKNILAKGYISNWPEEVFMTKKVKIAVPLTYVISDLNREKIVGMFSEEELQKTNQKEFGIEKIVKKKVVNYMLSGKVMIIRVIVGLIKTISLCKMSYFSEPYTCNKNKIKVELDLSNYVTKSDLKNTTGVDTSNFAKKMSDLASLKATIDKLEKLQSDISNLKRKVDKLDADKLKTVPADLSKLKDVVKK